MQILISVNNPRLAQAFVDYMATQKIECQLAPAEQGVMICLLDDQHLEFAQQELEAFLANPNANKYAAASWEVADTRKAKFSYQSSQSITQNFLSHAGPFTLVTLGLAALIYALMQLGFERSLFDSLRILDPFASNLEQPWRFITPILLHFSIVHIVFNCLWWWQLGGEIERRLGSQKLILITLVAAIIPNVAQLWATGPYFGGLSGVVYALLGYCWFSTWLMPQKGLMISRSIVGFMLVWLVFGFMDIAGPPMANLAHLFGLIVGCLQAVIDRFIGKNNG